jgi:choline dehydrogenase-like flavoprotein
MGLSAEDSVVDSTHRVHGVANLFVADSSVFPTAVSVDPSLTIMGFSCIAARHVLDSLA